MTHMLKVNHAGMSFLAPDPPPRLLASSHLGPVILSVEFSSTYTRLPMHFTPRLTRHGALMSIVVLSACARTTAPATTVAPLTPATGDTATIRTLVGRLDLERYKATIKGLTQFGDRR